MAKFKVGDKVRVIDNPERMKRYYATDSSTWDDFVDGMLNLRGKVLTIRKINLNGKYFVRENSYNWTDEMFSGLASDQPRREFIVIHQNGNVMTAEHRVNREVIKSAKATCSENDTFDLMVGAQIALDKLTGRYVKPQKEPKPEPKPAHRFKVGDRVKHIEYGLGTITEIINFVSGVPYRVKPDDKDCYCNHWAEGKVSPAPEPPKFYTGKVVCISGEYGVGRIFTVKDGFFADRQYNCPEKPYKSVDDMNDRFLFGKFAEAKE